jgi:hypothetical protein
MAATKRKKSAWELFVTAGWLFVLIGPGLLFSTWAVAALISRETPLPLRWVAGIGLGVVLGLAIAIVVWDSRRERRARELIAADCATRGYSDVTITIRKTHYGVSFVDGAARRSGKCRVHVGKRIVEWIAGG